MPVILHRAPQTESVSEDVSSRLLDAAGALTLEGRVVLAFLESVNFDDILTDPELDEFVIGETFKKKTKKEKDAEEDKADGGDDEDEEDAMEEGAEFTVMKMEGEDAAEFVDADDLFGMFEWFVGQMPAATVEEKVLKAAGLRLLGEEIEDVMEAAKEGDEGAVKLDEAKGSFSKGDFVKIRKGTKKTSLGKTGKDLVTQMMLAMFHKGAIKRSPEKGAYKAPGAKVHTWKRDSGYGEGTTSGKAKVAKYKMSKKGAQAKTKKKVKGAQGAEMKAKGKEAAAKAKAKANRLEKKKPGAVSGGKKSLVAHDTDVRNDRMDEGLSLTQGILAGMAKSKTAIKPLQG